MTSTRLRMTQRDFKALTRIMRPSFVGVDGPECGAIGVVGESNAATVHEFVLAKLFIPEGNDLKVAAQQEIVFDASYLRRAHLFMRSNHLAGLVVFHTHPGADERVRFSWYDDSQEPFLIENLQEMAPGTRLCSVVAGRQSLCGRVWHSRSQVVPLDLLAVVGETLEFRRLDGEPEPPPPPPAAAFDRALALTGAGALARLARMTIAVVGVSGTGSLVAELLVRAGCGRVLLIDDDVVKQINLNRILHSSVADKENATPKVVTLKAALDRIGMACEVVAVQSNVLLRETLMRLRDADVVIGCVDRAWPRQMLSEFAFQYLKPYIDIGTEIGADAQGVVALNARTNYVIPGRPCLSCTGLVTPRRLAYESLAAGERARVKAQGYSDDLAIDQPAVMDLNMHAAGTGMLLLRHLLQPFMVAPFPVAVTENLVTYASLAVRDAKAAVADCPTCQCNSHLGYGDCGPQLGLSEDVLRSICSP